MSWWEADPTPDQLQEALELMLSAGAEEYNPDVTGLLSDLFARQKEFLLDKSPHKALLKGRRAGGTFCLIRHLWYSAITKPGTCALYIAKTRKVAKGLVWSDIKRLNREYLLGGEANETELIMRLPNGSTIWVSGCDKIGDAEKFRGLSYSLCVLDEAASFNSRNIEYLLEQVISAALKENEGAIVVVGTPGRILHGFFYDITAGSQRNLYKQFFWTALQNPNYPLWAGKSNWRSLAKNHMRNWAISEFKGLQDPRFLREYKGQWVRDTDCLMLSYDPKINSYECVPRDLTRHIMGVDLGWSDKCAFVDISWNPYRPEVYIHNVHSESFMNIDQVARIVGERLEERRYLEVVCDTGGLGKQIVESINSRHRLNIKPADKHNKRDYIALMNNDLERGWILCNPDDTWSEQAAKIVWNTDRTREAENQECDVVDAALYAYREAYTKFTRPKPAKKTEEELIWEADEYSRDSDSNPYEF